MKKDFQDRIDEYILGRMSDEDKAQFEAEVNQDPSKKEQLEFTRNVKSAITSREDKLAKMKMMKQMYDSEHWQAGVSARPTGTDDRAYAPAPQNYTPAPQNSEKKSSRRIWWWASGVAAVLVIALFVVNPFKHKHISIGSSPSEILRGEDNEVFNMETPVLNDSTVSDTIQSCDSVPFINDDKNETDK